MVSPRRTIRRSFSIAGVIGLVAVAHEFGVKYAEQMGWYDNLPGKVETAMMWLASISEPLWFKVLTAFLIGSAVGMWIDAKLKDRETQKDRLDRNAVADEAEALARRLGQLAAEGVAREQIAWEEDNAASARASMEGHRLYHVNERSTAARARTMERFGEYHYDVNSIVAKSQKFIALNRTDIWDINGNLSSGRDLSALARVLARISVEIRYPQANVPIREERYEQATLINQQSEGSAPQLPSTPEP